MLTLLLWLCAYKRYYGSLVWSHDWNANWSKSLIRVDTWVKVKCVIPPFPTGDTHTFMYTLHTVRNQNTDTANYTFLPTYAGTHACTYAHTHTHARTHIHTHTHTHKQREVDSVWHSTHAVLLVNAGIVGRAWASFNSLLTNDVIEVNMLYSSAQLVQQNTKKKSNYTI